MKPKKTKQNTQYYWYCTYERGHGAWSDPDYEQCRARSKKVFSNFEQAEKASFKHSCRTGHVVNVARE